MIIIGVDYHPSFQTIAFLMEETGEYGEQELNHGDGQAERFYGELKERGVSVYGVTGFRHGERIRCPRSALRHFRTTNSPRKLRSD